MTEKKVYQADWVPNAQQNTPSYEILRDELAKAEAERMMGDMAIKDQVQRLIEQWRKENPTGRV